MPAGACSHISPVRCCSGSSSICQPCLTASGVSYSSKTTDLAWRLNNAKFTPPLVTWAPSGKGLPGSMVLRSLDSGNPPRCCNRPLLLCLGYPSVRLYSGLPMLCNVITTRLPAPRLGKKHSADQKFTGKASQNSGSSQTGEN
jgi:hypothetical protein